MPSSARDRDNRHLHSFPTRRSSDLASPTRCCSWPRSSPFSRCAASSSTSCPRATSHGGRSGPALSSSHSRPASRTPCIRSTWRTSRDRKSTRLNSSHQIISYAVFCSRPRQPPPPLFPYTTLFRSGLANALLLVAALVAVFAVCCIIFYFVPKGHVPWRAVWPGALFVTLTTGVANAVYPFYLANVSRSEEHTSELQSPDHLVCRLLLETATTATSTLSLHDALPIWPRQRAAARGRARRRFRGVLHHLLLRAQGPRPMAGGLARRSLRHTHDRRRERRVSVLPGERLEIGRAHV